VHPALSDTTVDEPVDRARVIAFYEATARAIDRPGARPAPALEEGLPADLLDEVAEWAGSGVRAARRFALNTGCGSGSVAAALIRAGVPLVGLDLAHGMARRTARLHRRPPGALFLRADGARTPFTDRTFGAVVDVSTFRHYPRPDVVANEWARLLAPKGVVVLGDVVEKDQDEDRFLTSLERVMRPGTINTCYKPPELVYYLESAGLTIEKASFARLKKPFARFDADVCGAAGTDPAAYRRALARAAPETREMYEVTEEAMVWRYTVLLARKR
jgi:SAM-dependent methyltransferase